MILCSKLLRRLQLRQSLLGPPASTFMHVASVAEPSMSMQLACKATDAMTFWYAQAGRSMLREIQTLFAVCTNCKAGGKGM